MTSDVFPIILTPLTSEKEGAVRSLIRRNLIVLDEHETVLVSTYKRLKHLHDSYTQEGCQFWVACEESPDGKPIGCAGLGPFHGLPLSEGMGEIRDLVVEEFMRGRGMGKLLLDNAVEGAKRAGYRRLYLETSKSMVVAQKLFESRGFRPVTVKIPLSGVVEMMPSYYLLENL